ncbi:hypothetical protein B7453_29015 [Pseudomonas sp. IB20]|nr:hypothetical protein B7453_29015 [Pseudomonas sp. IB20]
MAESLNCVVYLLMKSLRSWTSVQLLGRTSVFQSTLLWLTHRFREQARSHSLIFTGFQEAFSIRGFLQGFQVVARKAAD